jgi:hypothetical protein
VAAWWLRSAVKVLLLVRFWLPVESASHGALPVFLTSQPWEQEPGARQPLAHCLFFRSWLARARA